MRRTTTLMYHKCPNPDSYEQFMTEDGCNASQDKIIADIKEQIEEMLLHDTITGKITVTFEEKP